MPASWRMRTWTLKWRAIPRCVYEKRRVLSERWTKELYPLVISHSYWKLMKIAHLYIVDLRIKDVFFFLGYVSLPDGIYMESFLEWGYEIIQVRPWLNIETHGDLGIPILRNLHIPGYPSIHYITLRYVTLHYITLHTYIYIYTYTHIIILYIYMLSQHQKIEKVKMTTISVGFYKLLTLWGCYF